MGLAIDTNNQLIYRWGIVPLWLLLTCTVFFRYPIPIDETRYLSVAWEMWLRDDFWVPYLNGHPYSHKPPLLFWLFQSGWAVFGVNDWWPKLVGPFGALINLLLTRKLAERLWPNQANVALLAPWILIATLLWTLFATSAMFDILLTCFVLWGMLGLLALAQGEVRKGRVYLALAIGLGLLAKGPVMLLHILPAALLVRYWSVQALPKAWLLNLLVALLAGVVLALCWAIPAAVLGGEEFANAILWRQIADRTIATEIHARPFFWYMQFLPLLLFPWFFWPQLWRNLRQIDVANDNGVRFCLIWLLLGLLLFSVLTSKQIHYLIPVMPAFALLAARSLVNFATGGGLVSELVLPVAFALVGVFLVLLPQVPLLSKLYWVQEVEAGWGLSVLLITVLMALALQVVQKLSVAVISTALVLAVFVGFIFFFKFTGLAYNLRPAAMQVKSYQEQGIPCAFAGNYQGQFQFLGRLTQPLTQLQTAEKLDEWVEQHPEGFLISLEKEKPVRSVYQQLQREYWLVFRRAAQKSELKPL